MKVIWKYLWLQGAFLVFWRTLFWTIFHIKVSSIKAYLQPKNLTWLYFWIFMCSNWVHWGHRWRRRERRLFWGSLRATIRRTGFIWISVSIISKLGKLDAATFFFCYPPDMWKKKIIYCWITHHFHLCITMCLAARCRNWKRQHIVKDGFFWWCEWSHSTYWHVSSKDIPGNVTCVCITSYQYIIVFMQLFCCTEKRCSLILPRP